MKDKTKQRISELISQGISNGTAAGISILVRKDDKEVYFDAQGYADRGKIELSAEILFSNCIPCQNR